MGPVDSRRRAVEDPDGGLGSGGAEAGKDDVHAGLPVEAISLEKTVSGKRQDGSRSQVPPGAHA